MGRKQRIGLFISQSQFLNLGHLSQDSASHLYWIQICSWNKTKGRSELCPGLPLQLSAPFPGCHYGSHMSFSHISVSSSESSSRFPPYIISCLLKTGNVNAKPRSQFKSQLYHSLPASWASVLWSVKGRGVTHPSHGASGTMMWADTHKGLTMHLTHGKLCINVILSILDIFCLKSALVIFTLLEFVAFLINDPSHLDLEIQCLLCLCPPYPVSLQAKPSFSTSSMPSSPTRLMPDLSP